MQTELAKEESVKRRLEYEDKIAQIDAQQKVDDKNYNGPKVNVEATGQVGTYNGQRDQNGNLVQTGTLEYSYNKDATIDIVNALASTEGLGELTKASFVDEKQGPLITQALANAGFSPEQIESIKTQLEAILADDDQAKEFLGLIRDHTADIASKEALEQAQARETLGNSNEFNNLTADSQQSAVNAYLKATPEIQEQIDERIGAGEDLTDVYKDLKLATDDLILKTQVLDQTIDKLDEDVDEVEFENLTKFLNSTKIKGLSDQLLDVEEAAQDVAEAILRFDDACQDVSENYNDWMHALKHGTIQDQANAVAELNDAYMDLLDLDAGDQFAGLSDEFLRSEKNLDLMKAAAEGSEKAYSELMLAAQQDILGQVGLDTADFDAKFDQINNNIQNGLKKIEIGAFIDDTQALQSMNELINAADMTADQATALLASMGVDAEVEQVTVPKKDKKEMISAEPEITYEKAEVPTIAQDALGGATVNNTTVQVPHINYKPVKATDVEEGEDTATMLRVKSARKSSGGGFKYTHSNHGGGSGGSKGGGSKSTKKTVQKPKEHVKNVSEKDRYHNIKEQIEDLNTEMDRLNKNKDRAYGKDRIKYMDQEIDRTKQQIDLTQKYIKEIKAYAKEDKKALEKSLAEIGMSQKEIADQFGPDGVLKDYEGLLDAIQKKFDETATASYNNAIDAYNRAVEAFNNSAQDDAAKETFDNAKNALDAAKEVYDKQKEQYQQQLDNLKQYEDTINLWQEKRQEEIDQMNDLADRLIEKAGYKFEIKLDLDQDVIDHLSWLYDNLGDSADKAVDRIANLTSQLALNRKAINDNVDSIKEMVSELSE